MDNYRGAGVYPRRPHALLRRQVHVFGAVAHERARAGLPKEPNSAPERQEPLQGPLLVRALVQPVGGELTHRSPAPERPGTVRSG